MPRLSANYNKKYTHQYCQRGRRSLSGLIQTKQQDSWCNMTAVMSESNAILPWHGIAQGWERYLHLREREYDSDSDCCSGGANPSIRWNRYVTITQSGSSSAYDGILRPGVCGLGGHPNEVPNRSIHCVEELLTRGFWEVTTKITFARGTTESIFNTLDYKVAVLCQVSYNQIV